VTVNVRAAAHEHMDIRFSFSFNIDQAQLPAFIAAIKGFFLA
jgi:hypothetical protein